MRHKRDRTKGVRVDPRLFQAARHVLGLSWEDIERETGATYRHLLFWLRGERDISDVLLQRLRHAFGPTWAFVIGESTELRRDQRRIAA